jgi:hypothetical protein
MTVTPHLAQKLRARGCYTPAMPRTSAAKRPTPLIDPRDRDALLDAGNRVLLEGLGIDNALEFLRLVGGGRDRFEDIRRQWAGLSMDEALAELRRSGLA